MPPFSDLLLIVLLGAGIWSSIQIQMPDAPRSLSRIGQTAVIEGAMVAVVWLIVTALLERQLAAAALQSLLIGGVWSAFTFVARGAIAVQADSI